MERSNVCMFETFRLQFLVNQLMSGLNILDVIIIIYLFINDQSFYHIETSQLILSNNQLTDFYIIETLVVNR